MIRLLHTADLHLGKPFGRFPAGADGGSPRVGDGTASPARTGDPQIHNLVL